MRNDLIAVIALMSHFQPNRLCSEALQYSNHLWLLHCLPHHLL
jgi:hypothetical protein